MYHSARDEARLHFSRTVPSKFEGFEGKHVTFGPFFLTGPVLSAAESPKCSKSPNIGRFVAVIFKTKNRLSYCLKNHKKNTDLDLGAPELEDLLDRAWYSSHSWMVEGTNIANR